MHLTPAILEAAYSYLRSTPPFNRWKLPEADAVEFRVTNTKHYGDYSTWESKQFPVMRISQLCCAKTKDLIDTVAHEMVHLHQFDDARYRNTRAAFHGPKFKRLAAQVCRHHGFDLKRF